MNRYLGLDRLGIGVARRLLALWVRTKVLPGDVSTLGIDPQLPVCYALEMRALSDLLVLDRETRDAGLPRPTRELELGERRSSHAVFATRRMRGWILKRVESQIPPLLHEIAGAVVGDSGLDVQLVPVSIFWGRAPQKETSVFKALFAERWLPQGRLRKFLTILLHGRTVLVQFGQPLSARAELEPDMQAENAARKLARLLRVHFKGVRTAAIGPDLSHRNTLIGELLEAPAVSSQIKREALASKSDEREVRERAREYALEIAADYSPGFVTLAERILERLWNRLYDGIAVRHMDEVIELSRSRTIIYVPCHRSHIDYLLLSYVLYRHGLVPPHIAAGLNLNLPLLGGVLRRGGAFFLRRSFRGNKVYAAVFHEYLRANLAKGVSIEYFIEGGRSRTGRLLRPKPGMLSMTVRSFLSQPDKPLAFVPVYIGYDRLVEGQSYIGELSGKPKGKESWLGFLRSLKILRSEFGTVQLSFGAAIDVGAYLDEHAPGWRDGSYTGEEKPVWLSDTVAGLAEDIMVRINQATAVSPVNLLALVLLATPRQAMAEQTLVRQLEMLQALIAGTRSSSLITVPGISGHDVISEGEDIGLLARRKHELGDILTLAGDQAVLATYFRNNILHLVALPSLVACGFLHNESLSKARLIDLCKMAYPSIRAELFLPYADEELDAAIEGVVKMMKDLGLLNESRMGRRLSRPPVSSKFAGQLSTLAQTTLQILERYYLVISLLRTHGSGKISQQDLETLCQLMARRMSIIYQMDAPDFFARELFRGFINELKFSGVVTVSAEGKLEFDDTLRTVSENAQYVLSEEIRHSILRVTQE